MTSIANTSVGWAAGFQRRPLAAGGTSFPVWRIGTVSNSISAVSNYTRSEEVHYSFQPLAFDVAVLWVIRTCEVASKGGLILEQNWPETVLGLENILANRTRKVPEFRGVKMEG